MRLTSGRRGTFVEGRLVDVGAGGLRLACTAPAPAPGAQVLVEILLDDPTPAPGPPRLVLDGAGRIVWMNEDPDEALHIGVSFDAPVDVRRSFPDLSVYE